MGGPYFVVIDSDQVACDAHNGCFAVLLVLDTRDSRDRPEQGYAVGAYRDGEVYNP